MCEPVSIVVIMWCVDNYSRSMPSTHLTAWLVDCLTIVNLLRICSKGSKTTTSGDYSCWLLFLHLSRCVCVCVVSVCVFVASGVTSERFSRMKWDRYWVRRPWYQNIYLNWIYCNDWLTCNWIDLFLSLHSLHFNDTLSLSSIISSKQVGSKLSNLS